MLHNVFPKLRALDLAGVIHEASKVISDPFRADGAIYTLEDEVGGLGPAKVAQHHFAAEDD